MLANNKAVFFLVYETSTSKNEVHTHTREKVYVTKHFKRKRTSIGQFHKMFVINEVIIFELTAPKNKIISHL